MMRTYFVDGLVEAAIQPKELKAGAYTRSLFSLI